MNKEEKNKDNDTCKICYENMEFPLYLTCAHVFCKTCIEKCIKYRTRKCPVCRIRITWTISQMRLYYN